jgi:cytosine/adenosine deaminase-related metal-dependent hydrolase
VSIAEGKISSVDPYTIEPLSTGTPTDVLDGGNRLLAPSLCHAHIHLDKCFLLQDPKFADLQIEKGDFHEAMEMTRKAKTRFEEEDLLRRGRQLIEESLRYGVTAMRAFVEVDGGVQFKCLDAGFKLKEEFQGRCELQICAFAQLPLFSGEDGGETVRGLMSEAAHREGVDVLGSTPYVEEDEAKSKSNVHWIATLALSSRRHLDLHLDYFLEQSKQPLIFHVLDVLKERNWAEQTDKQVALGHCTRLTLFKENDWRHLKHEIAAACLPVSFIGLPTSDLFMMRTDDMVRGSLPVVEMIERHGLNAAIAVNNVGNAFTPYGNCDPLSIASLGVGLYQAGTTRATEILYASSLFLCRVTLFVSLLTDLQETISSRAKAAIGCSSTSLGLAPGEPADFVLFDRMDAGWRCRKSIAEVVYDPPVSRQTIFRGRLTAF